MTETAEESVVKGLGRCLLRLQSGPWLDSKTAFRELKLATGFVLRPNSRSKRFENIAEYAAASSLLHCTDGWSYLGRAANAVANGLFDEATHLAYYSELRSAISILACSGTVIHNNRSYVLSNGNTMTMGVATGTHRIVWPLLHKWTLTTQATDVVGDMITIEGASLTDWLNSRSLGGNTPSIISSLLEMWGIDLKMIEADHLRRKIASYQPGRLENGASILTDDQICELLEDLPSLIEPSSPGTFPNVDIHLLAQALRLGGGLFSKLSPRGATLSGVPNSSEIQNLVDEVVGGFLDTGGLATRLEALMTSGSSLIRGATEKPTSAYPATAEDVLGMMGRALILARIATGYVNRIRESTGVNSSMLAPWANNLGPSLGYWDPGSRPVDMIELWDEMAEAVLSFKTKAFADSNLNSMHGSSPWEILILTSMTRAAMWNLSA